MENPEHFNVDDSDYGDEAENSDNRRMLMQQRKLAGEFDDIAGNQQSDVMYCDKRQFYMGTHSRCHKTMSSFFADDVSLLHPSPAE